jgi:hypothetical protein
MHIRARTPIALHVCCAAGGLGVAARGGHVYAKVDKDEKEGKGGEAHPQAPFTYSASNGSSRVPKDYDTKPKDVKFLTYTDPELKRIEEARSGTAWLL